MSAFTSFGSSETNHGCPMPPMNATNFTAANPPIYSTLISYAKNSPNYPLAPGTDARRVTMQQQNVSYFNTLNQQVAQVKALNTATGSRAPYPQFRSEQDRLNYLQGMYATAARNQMTGQNPSAPAGVPCSTLYQIIGGA